MSLHASHFGPSASASAAVNHGRWIVECPVGGCGGAQFIAIGQKTSACNDCGLAVVIEWPTNIAAISEALGHRQVPAVRNWSPPETVIDLWVENIAHGCSAVDDVPAGWRAAVSAAIVTPRAVKLLEWRELPNGQVEAWRLPGREADIVGLPSDVRARMLALPVCAELGAYQPARGRSRRDRT